MNPHVEPVLRDLAQRIAQDIAPTVEQFHRGALSLASGMLVMIADEWDRAAQRRVEENAAIRALLLDGAALVEPTLASRCRKLALATDADVRISTLEASNIALRSVLSDLHAALEATAGAPSAALQSRIWAELAASTERRRLSPANC